MIAAAALSLGGYLVGAFGVLWLVVVVLWASRWARLAWLPGFAGAPAHLAELVLALTLLYASVLSVGAIGMLRAGPVCLVVSLAALGIGVAGRQRARRPGASGDVEADPRTASRREEIVAACAAVVLVGAQWSTHVADALTRGMTHPDTLWYHGPFSARMLQIESFGELGRLGYLPSRHFPLNSELLHAIVALPFDRDVLSPLVNVFFAALALLAAWCLGRDKGVGAIAVLGVAMLLGMPTLAGTQPGQASNDVMCAALLLAGVALLRESRLRPAPTWLGGIAIGLAIGTKLTIAGPVAVLILGTAWYAVRRGRREGAVALLIGFVPPAAFWFVRNWVNVGNPVPFVNLHLGPIDLTATAPVAGDTSIVATLSDLSRWGNEYVIGLGRGYGPLWPVVLLGAVIAGWWTLTRGRDFDRVVGLTIVAGAIAYPFLPLTGKEGFGFNLRYLTPVLVLAFALLPSAVADVRLGVRRALLGSLGVLVLVNLTVSHREGVAAWPTDQWAVAVVGGIVLSAIAIAILRAHRPPALAGAGVIACIAMVAGGYWVQRSFLDGRYVGSGLDDAINEYFRDVRGSKVSLLGSAETYPLFGTDLSNRVTDETEFLTLGSPSHANECRFWRRRITDGTRFVAISDWGYPLVRHPSFEEQATTFGDAPGVVQVYRRGDAAIFRIDGGLDPRTCPATTADGG